MRYTRALLRNPHHRILLAGVLVLLLLTAQAPSAYAQSILDQIRDVLLLGAARGGNPVAGIFNETLDVFGGGLLALINAPLMAVLWLVTNILALILTFFGNALDYVLEITKFAGNEWVLRGWRTTRDSLNFVFILALLAIAFATIAGIEGYGMKKLLPRLIVAALLVNFSLAIGGAFVNVSKVLMKTLAGRRDAGTYLSTRLANVTVVHHFFTYNPAVVWQGVEPPVRTLADLRTRRQLEYAIKAVLATIMLAIVTVTIGAVALMLVIRVVMLFVLLILSPVGYVFAILPQTAGYAKRWWDTFIKYVLFGPVVIFFLAIATTIGTRGGQGAQVGFRTLSEQLGIQPGNAVARFFLDQPLFGSMFEAVFVVIFIIIGLLVAQQAGVMGASIGTWAAGFARSALAASPLIAGRAAGYGVRETARAGLGGLGRIPYVGGLLRGASSAVSTVESLRTGKERSEVVAEQQKAVKQYGNDYLKKLMLAGNAGAAAELLDRGELSTEREFATARQLIPTGTTMSDKFVKSYRERFPVTGTKSTIRKGEDPDKEIEKSWKRMREPEKLAKVLADKTEGPEIIRRIKGDNLEKGEKALPVFTRSQAEALMETDEGVKALRAAMEHGTLKGPAEEFTRRVFRSPPQPPPAPHISDTNEPIGP